LISKHPPFLQKVSLKSLLAGGGVPHRMGISDIILIFREHLLFAVIPQAKHQQNERQGVVEAHGLTKL
jgi:molybdenum transport protein